jgi:S1-C subfamily serine protease
MIMKTNENSICRSGHLAKLLTFIAAAAACILFTACNIAAAADTEPKIVYETVYKTTAVYETVDINELYELYKSEKLAEYPDAAVSFADFIQYLSLSVSDTEYAATKGMQSVVTIFDTFTCRQLLGYDRRTGQPVYNTYTSQSAGTGVIYKVTDDTVYIVTNYHIIYDGNSTAENKIADEILIYTHGDGDTAITAEFVGGDIDRDIAVLKIDKCTADEDTLTALGEIRAASLADTDTVRAGQTAVAIGNSLGLGLKVTAGVISDLNVEVTMSALDITDTDGEMTLYLIQTDTAINSGNSGGGLFNTRGELIGIVNAKMVSAGVESTGYAIPFNAENTAVVDGIIDGDTGVNG